MSATFSPQPDPSAIGGVASAHFVLRPDPTRLFARRATRFATLAAGHTLAPYLTFLSALSGAQDEAVATAPVPAAPDPGVIARAASANMPPIDRAHLADDPAFAATIAVVLEGAARLPMPPTAREALDRLRRAPADVLGSLAAEADQGPGDDLAGVLFIEAGAQVYGARLAATLEPTRLVPVGTGVCPACGGRPVGSVVVGFEGAEGARYALCAFCATAWNEVRIKCLACGSTKGVGYRAVEAEGEAPTVKAEVCDQCHAWTKIFHQNKNPSLEAIADDVGTIALDVLMGDTPFRRVGAGPFAMGF